MKYIIILALQIFPVIDIKVYCTTSNPNGRKNIANINDVSL